MTERRVCHNMQPGFTALQPVVEVTGFRRTTGRPNQKCWFWDKITHASDRGDCTIHLSQAFGPHGDGGREKMMILFDELVPLTDSDFRRCRFRGTLITAI